MIILIGAVNYQNDSGKLGIGYDGKIPWDLKEDLNHFKEETTGHVVVMGRKTYESIGSKPLPNRINIVLSSSLKCEEKDNLLIYKNIFEISYKLNELQSKYKIYIIGGSFLYEQFIHSCDYIILTEIKGKYKCDTYFPEIPHYFKIINNKILNNSNIKVLEYKSYKNDLINDHPDIIYKELAVDILENGNKRKDRTNVGTISIFGKQIRFDISEYCPLLTTKKVAWKTCIKELLWLLRGETDAKILQKQNVHIWDGNSSREFLDNRGLYEYPEGEIGKVYGWQIRHSGGDFKSRKGGVDQLKYIEDLLENDPYSRRILWNLWIPSDLDKMALTPCHYALELYVLEKNNEKYLSGKVNLRSNDIFLGNPFNIFSYYVLIRLLCIKHNMKPYELILSIGDAHIYSNHIEQIKKQLDRRPRSLPILEIGSDIRDKRWEEITINDFDLIGYFPDTPIKGEMAI